MMGSGTSGWIYRKSRYHFYSGIIACAICVSCVFLGNFSYIYYRIQNENNPEVATKTHNESENPTLKLSHMLLPQENHRIKALSAIKSKYKPIIYVEGIK